MQIINTLFIFGVFLLKTVCSEFCCCKQALPNGSMFYTLNSTVPENWTKTWTLNESVIVDEEGNMARDLVVSQRENWCILNKDYSTVVCRLESPTDGVSEEISCTDPCKPSPVTSGTVAGKEIPPLHIALIVLPILLLLLIGLLVYNRCKRSNHKSGDVEIPLNEPNQDQDQDHDQD